MRLDRSARDTGQRALAEGIIVLIALVALVAGSVAVFGRLIVGREWSRRQAAFLAEASAVLDTPVELEDTLGAFSRLAVPQVADWCTVELMDDRGVLAHARGRARRARPRSRWCGACASALRGLAARHGRRPGERRQQRRAGALPHTLRGVPAGGARVDDEHLNTMFELGDGQLVGDGRADDRPRSHLRRDHVRLTSGRAGATRPGRPRARLGAGAARRACGRHPRGCCATASRPLACCRRSLLPGRAPGDP